MTKHFLDARELEHPVPLEKAIEALKKLDNKSYLYMIHRKEPVPLLALANEHNLSFISKEIGKNWHILITPHQSLDLTKLIEEF